MRTVRALPEVSGDISRAARWYNRREPGLGFRFAETSYQVIDDLAAAPLAHRLIYREFRRGLMKRFPYAFYYKVTDSEMVIVLVFHTARNPDTLKRMLRKREAAS